MEHGTPLYLSIRRAVRGRNDRLCTPGDAANFPRCSEMLFRNDKIITRRMRGIGGWQEGRNEGREGGKGGGGQVPPWRTKAKEGKRGGTGRGEGGDDHAEFSFKTSLRICAFANFGRRLDARLFIPAALRLASSTSLFAHLIGRRPLPGRAKGDSHSAE